MTSFHVTKSDREYAEKLTKQIRESAEDLWTLLLQAWETKAYVSLGYKSWSAYVDKEFDFNRRHSYRLINQGQVVKQLREAAGVSERTQVVVSEMAAREIAPVIGVVAEEVREAVASGVPAAEAVRLAVETHRPGPGFTRTQFSDEFTEEPATCAHEYVCRHCGELLQ